MALAPDVSSSTDPHKIEKPGEHIHAPGLQGFVFALFLIFGGITSLNDVIIPKLKELFTLNFTQAMLVQFCFFTAYLVIGIPGAKLVKRIGYMRGAVAGLLTMLAGCLLFIPASQTATYALFLFALFVLASGVVIVQVVANPLISLLGPAKTSHSRLTFAQAFNSLGTTIFPIIGAALILGSLADLSASELTGPELSAYRTAESQAIVGGYLAIAVMLAIVAAVVWMFRNKLEGEKHEPSSGLGGLDLLKRKRFGFGALCIFLYVGAEVSIGSLIVSYLELPGVRARTSTGFRFRVGVGRPGRNSPAAAAGGVGCREEEGGGFFQGGGQQLEAHRKQCPQGGWPSHGSGSMLRQIMRRISKSIYELCCIQGFSKN